VLAEFAHDEVLSINIDGAGALFFQSAGTGCVGNGTVAAYGSGEFSAYNATLAIDGCTGAYDYLNGEFEGLATRSMNNESSEGWGSRLLVWLSSKDGTPYPVALSMWSDDLTCRGCWDYW
jgi:hypothetical protein